MMMTWNTDTLFNAICSYIFLAMNVGMLLFLIGTIIYLVSNTWRTAYNNIKLERSYLPLWKFLWNLRREYKCLYWKASGDWIKRDIKRGILAEPPNGCVYKAQYKYYEKADRWELRKFSTKPQELAEAQNRG